MKLATRRFLTCELLGRSLGKDDPTMSFNDQFTERQA